MKVTLTNKELVSSLQGLQELALLKLPVRVAWNIGRNIDVIQKNMDVYTKAANGLVEKYRDPEDDKEKVMGIKLTDPAAYQADVAELQSIEVEFDIRQITISDLGSKAEITSGSLANLVWLFKDEEDAETPK